MNKKAFSLIEIMIWILIASMVIIWWFQALNAVMVWKIKLIESTDISKEAFKFSQKFFEEIKAWGTIDYEEYFNRKVVWNTEYLSGHYKKNTDFWNSWTNSNWYYYCRSWNWITNKMSSFWCLEQKYNNSWQDQFWEKQRFGQYTFQFRDYNSNYDWDLGDEDSDWNIIWDDDDEDLGIGPEVFESGTWVTEIYLISADKRKRTIFRWNVKKDPDAWNLTCNFSNQKTPTWAWCLWTIEFLKLDWKDWWFNHSKSWSWYLDWIVDTWIINKDFVENAWETWVKIAEWNLDKYFIPLFPNSINVKNFDVRIYPNNDRNLAWKTDKYDISPYLRIKMTLTPSWKVKKKIRWIPPEFNISTTVNLTPLFSR